MPRTGKPARAFVTEWDQLSGGANDAEVLLEIAAVEGDENALAELAESVVDLERNVDAFELRSLLSGEYDALGAIVQINAGAGGTESQD